MEAAYFLDTYALIELLRKNPCYKPYRKGKLITTRLNLMELHYFLLRNGWKKEADFYYHYFLKIVVEITDDDFKKASGLRFAFKKRNISYIDCLGYVIAQSRRMKFLTGDKEFKDLENVEFVK